LILLALFRRPRRGAPPAVRASLRDPRFGLLVAGETVNSVGGWASAIVLWGFAAYRFGASPQQVSLTIVCWAAPPALLSPLAGVYVDRIGPGRAVIAGYLGAAAAALGMAAAGSLAVLDVAAVAYGAARALAGPAAGALPPRVVGDDDLLAANALLGAAASAGQVAGPLVASAALALSGFPAAFMVDAASYVIGAAVVAPLRLRPLPDRPRAGKSGWKHELASGVRLTLHQTGLRLVLALSAAVTFTSAAYLVVEPLYARHVLHRPPSQFALFEAAAGAGSILCGLAISRARSRLAGPRLLAAAAAGYGLAAALFTGTTVVPVAYAGAFLWGVSGALFGVVAVTTLQRVAPVHAHGRVMGVSATLQSWVETIGLPLGGGTLAALGIRAGALALAAVAAAAGMTCLLASVIRPRDSCWPYQLPGWRHAGRARDGRGYWRHPSGGWRMDSLMPVTDSRGRRAESVTPAEPATPGEAWPGTFTPPPVADRPARGPGALRRDVAGLLRAPFSRRARRERLYVTLSSLLALAGLAWIAVTLTAGAGLTVSGPGLLLGLPLLAGALLGARQVGAASRSLASGLVGVRAERPRLLPSQKGVLGWIRSVLTDRAGWRACLYLLLKLPLAVLGLVAASLIVVYGIPYLTFPLWWEVIHQLTVHGVAVQIPGWLTWWQWDPVRVAQAVPSLAVSFALIPVGALVILTAPWQIRAVIAVDTALITRLLGATSLPERVRELEQARARVVDDSAARLRRIERDLHDGAQAQMVAVAMKLGLAREKLGGAGPGARAEADLERALELIDAAHRSAKEAILELRDLARGIHPPVLDHGLGTALATLAARSEVPVELVVDLPERPSAAIETIAYFCAAELLANVAKHSRARHATLEAVHVPGLVRLRIGDDGGGGARIEPGGGLAGLDERIRTVDGRIEVSSPAGGPTLVTVELPSHV
jgi:signal transduction histidine kinase/predicted MFS family arabinose efflux permease